MSDDLEIEAQPDTKRISDDDAPDQSGDLARLELDDLDQLVRDIRASAASAGWKPTPTSIPVQVSVPWYDGTGYDGRRGQRGFLHIDSSVLYAAIEEEARILYETIRKAELRNDERLAERDAEWDAERDAWDAERGIEP